MNDIIRKRKTARLYAVLNIEITYLVFNGQARKERIQGEVGLRLILKF